MEADPTHDALVVIDRVGDRPFGPGVEPLNWKERPLPPAVCDRLTEKPISITRDWAVRGPGGRELLELNDFVIRRRRHVRALLFGHEPDKSRASPLEVGG